MNINICEKYKVIITSEYTTLSEECESKYDNIFVKHEYHNEEIISGVKLQEMIGYELQHPGLFEFVIIGNQMHFEYFNPSNGEFGSKCFTIESTYEKVGDIMNKKIYNWINENLNSHNFYDIVESGDSNIIFLKWKGTDKVFATLYKDSIKKAMKDERK